MYCNNNVSLLVNSASKLLFCPLPPLCLSLSYSLWAQLQSLQSPWLFISPAHLLQCKNSSFPCSHCPIVPLAAHGFQCVVAFVELFAVLVPSFVITLKFFTCAMLPFPPEGLSQYIFFSKVQFLLY